MQQRYYFFNAKQLNDFIIIEIELYFFIVIYKIFLQDVVEDSGEAAVGSLPMQETI